MLPNMSLLIVRSNSFVVEWSIRLDIGMRTDKEYCFESYSGPRRVAAITSLRYVAVVNG